MGIRSHPVCGIDVGSLATPSYVAWLRGGEFLLDLYVPSAAVPLPQPPTGWGQPAFVAVDAPQGLPAPGRGRRLADAEARTPTSVLPRDRIELAEWKLYRGLIEAGLEIFWSVHERRLASVEGLPPVPESPTTVLETYPRFVIRRLRPALGIPSKRRAPLAYVDAVLPLIEAAGCSCAGVARPGVDHVDAMLCALAAAARAAGSAHRVGAPPLVDVPARVLREGFIVVP